MARRFWVVSPNVNNDLSVFERWIDVITKNRAAFMGWSSHEGSGPTFYNEVQIGDIILVARGTSNRRLIACGRVASQPLEDESSLSFPPDGLEFGAYRLLDPFLTLPESPQDAGLDFGGVQNPGARPP